MFKSKSVFYMVLLLSDAIGFGLILPLLPHILIHDGFFFTGNGHVFRALVYSVSLSGFYIALMFGSHLLDYITSRYGRYNVLLISMCGTVSGYFFIIVALYLHFLWLFLLARIMCGFFSGAYVLDGVVLPGNENSYSSEIFKRKLPMVFLWGGIIIGPLLSMVSFDTPLVNSVMLPFLVPMSIGIVGIFLILPKHYGKSISQPMSTVSDDKFRLSVIFSDAYYLFCNSKTTFAALSYMFFQLGAGLFMQGFPIFLAIRLHEDPAEIGKFYAWLFVSWLFGQYILVKYVSKYMGWRMQLKISAVILSFIFVFIFVASGFTPSTRYVDPKLGLTVFFAIMYSLVPFLNLGFISLFMNKLELTQNNAILPKMRQLYLLAWAVSGMMVGVVLYHRMMVLLVGVFFILGGIFLYNSLRATRMQGMRDIFKYLDEL